jgi:hypothetical protein
LLLRKQLQNFSSFGGTRSPVRELSIKPDISSIEEPLQAHRIHVKAALVFLLNFFACHAHDSRLRETAPANALNACEKAYLR